jgi:hypothetical protein
MIEKIKMNINFSKLENDKVMLDIEQNEINYINQILVCY